MLVHCQLLLHEASALVASANSARCTRRGALAGAFVASLPKLPAFAGGAEEAKAAAAARKAAETAAKDPINRLNKARDTLAGVPGLLEGVNPDLGLARAALSQTKPQRIAGERWEAQVEGVAYVVRDVITKDSALFKSDVGAKRAQLLKEVQALDLFVYDNQNKTPQAISGYCAPGIVPRDEPGACKLRPPMDLAGAKAKTDAALKSLDAILKEVA